MRADRQKDTQTDTDAVIAIRRTPTAGKETMLMLM